MGVDGGATSGEAHRVGRVYLLQRADRRDRSLLSLFGARVPYAETQASRWWPMSDTQPTEAERLRDAAVALDSRAERLYQWYLLTSGKGWMLETRARLLLRLARELRA